jgi:hypothetical protein
MAGSASDVGGVRMSTREVLEAIARERARLLAAVDALGASAGTVTVTGEWTAKDVLAHCVHWVGQLAFGLGARLETPAWVAGVTGRPSGEEWNRRVVDHHRALSLAEMRREFDRHVDLLVERVDERTDEQMTATDAIPWDLGHPLWQQIGSETFTHWPTHAADIERARAEA